MMEQIIPSANHPNRLSVNIINGDNGVECSPKGLADDEPDWNQNGGSPTTNGSNGTCSPKESADEPDWRAIENDLYSTLQKLLATENESEIVRSEEGGNITVRQTFSDSNMISFGEVDLVRDIHPDDVLNFYDNWADCVTHVNPLVRRARVVGEGTDPSYQCIRYESHLPFPLSDRCFYSVKFVKRNVNPGEHVLLMSEKGNEKFVAETYTEKDKAKFVLGQCHLSSWIFKAVKDDDGKVIGSSVSYFISADACGVVPHWLQSRKGPSTVSEAIHGLIDYLRAEKKKKKKKCGGLS